MSLPKRLPFDSLCLAAVTAEMAPFVGGKLQRIVQPSDRRLYLGIYAGGSEHGVLLSCSATFARAHLAARRPASTGEPPMLAAALRKHVEGGRLAEVRQIGFDRVLELTFVRPEGAFRLLAELMGKHANLILVDPSGKVMAAAHFVSARQSSRPILPGRPYSPPPFPPRKPIYDAQSWEEFEDSEGGGPFLRQLLLAKAGVEEAARNEAAWGRLSTALAALKVTIESRDFKPVRVEGRGVYPLSTAALGGTEKLCESFSFELERHFEDLETSAEIEGLRARLVGPLQRVLLAREVALAELHQAQDTARNAGDLQTKGELILAYAHGMEAGQSVLEVPDYEGNPMQITLDPERSAVENATRYFDRAKAAKSRLGFVNEQSKRLESERVQVMSALRQAEDATKLSDLQDLFELARERRWLHVSTTARTPEERPFDGHRVRERIGPGGVRVLFGENATSNDYLTQRVARPNDIWLHVRGATSAHVVILTANRPERIGPEALRFAAEIAVQNSAAKHSGYVSVDYTLKKYVRKPRGAKAGAVVYTHEKTIAVERGR